MSSGHNKNTNARGGRRPAGGNAKGGGGKRDAKNAHPKERKPAPDPILNGALSLVEQIDKQVVVVLRDKKTLMGTLRSFDGYANIVLSDAYERVYVGKHYGDIPVKGWFIARAENVVLVGELDGKEADVAALTRVDADKIQELRKEERARDAEKRKFLADVLDEMQILDEF